MTHPTLLLALALLLPVSATAGTDDADTGIVTTRRGGHWQAGDQAGVYQVVQQPVGFEHVSCRVWIEWLATPTGADGAARLLARVPLQEASDGFWACARQPDALQLDNAVLSLRLQHAYSGEPRLFRVVLGAPGSYRLQAEPEPAP